MKNEILKIIEANEGTLKINPYFELIRDKGENFTGEKIDRLTIICNLGHYMEYFEEIDLTGERVNSDLVEHIEFLIDNFIALTMYKVSEKLRNNFKSGYTYGN